jgi:N-acetylmuramoyl-L-alanine amidase
MTHRRLANLLQKLLFRDDFAPVRQLVICLLLSAGVLVVFRWKNQSAPVSREQGCEITASVNSRKEDKFEVAEITANSGIARNGPSEDDSRLTPLPKGTRAIIIEKKKDWLRLDYGAWINRQEAQVLSTPISPRSLICQSAVVSRQVAGKTEVIFPLQTRVPMNAKQSERAFALTLYNTTVQKDIFRIGEDPIISGIDWQQVTADQIKYTFHLKGFQQWGYKLRYEGTNLIVSFRHPPHPRSLTMGMVEQPLSGIKILLDPGHGGIDTGAETPSGYREKDVNLIVARLLEAQLTSRGATVYLTRSDDKYLSLNERLEIIDRIEPAIALSIHYNYIPLGADAQQNQGVEIFWYHPQSRGLASSLQNYIVNKLGRPSKGVDWNNLALVRPTIAPSVLLELGFMSHPEELNWIINPQEQQKLGVTLADGITEWFRSVQ